MLSHHSCCHYSGLSLTFTPSPLTLPTSFSLLTYMTQLNLSSNGMTGSVPQLLSALNQLVYVVDIVSNAMQQRWMLCIRTSVGFLACQVLGLVVQLVERLRTGFLEPHDRTEVRLASAL